MVFAVLAVVASSLAPDAVFLVAAVVDNCLVEIIPLVRVVAVFVAIATAFLGIDQRRFANKGICIENVKPALLVKALDINVRHNVVSLCLGDGQPGLDRPGDAGIVDAGAPLSKGTEKEKTLL